MIREGAGRDAGPFLLTMELTKIEFLSMRILLALMTLSLVSFADKDVFDSVAPEAQKDLKYPIVWNVKQDIDTPESVYYDLESDSIFVSNVAGAPNAKDGKGWISKLSPAGKVIKAKWVDGLDAPKGMRAFQGNLWVTDLTKVHRFSIKNGKKLATIEVPGAVFLNDVAIDPLGRVYVSDTVTSKIHVIEKGKVSTFAEGPDLESPNGLIFIGETLYVGAWGLAAPDFSTKVPGRLYSMDVKTKEKKFVTPAPFANLDGLEETKGGFYVSDWKAGKVFFVGTDGKSELLFSGFKGSADLGYLPHRHLLIVPRMSENQITAFDMTSREK